MIRKINIVYVLLSISITKTYKCYLKNVKLSNQQYFIKIHIGLFTTTNICSNNNFTLHTIA